MAPNTERLDQLRQMHASANVAAVHTQNVHLTFLLFCAYVAITVASTTHEQLLRETNVTLPLLNVGVRLVWFYVVVPVFLLLLHLNLLLQLYLLSRQLYALDGEIRQSEREGHQRIQLYPLPFSHMLVGQHTGAVRWLLRAIVWVTVFVPVVLLVWTEGKFLPYHSSWITWWHALGTPPGCGFEVCALARRRFGGGRSSGCRSGRKRAHVCEYAKSAA